MGVDVHLIVGSTGAGKSTFARELALEHSGVVFVIDEWMMSLFGPDRPETAGYDWYAPRIERCTNMIWKVASELAKAGTPSVLEIGLTEVAARRAFYERVRTAGLRLQLHVLDAPVAVRWQRVSARNRERGQTFSLEVTRGMFDFVERMWQPPDDAELSEHDGERVDTSPSRANPA